MALRLLLSRLACLLWREPRFLHRVPSPLRWPACLLYLLLTRQERGLNTEAAASGTGGGRLGEGLEFTLLGVRLAPQGDLEYH